MVVRQLIVTGGILGLFLVVFLVMVVLMKALTASAVGIQGNAAAFIAFALGILFYRPVERFLADLTDRYLFQKAYDYQKLLRDASRGISKIESLHHLLGLVVHFVTMKMRVRTAAILTRLEDGEEFRLEYQRGYPRNFLDYRIPGESPLIFFLSRHKEAVSLTRLERMKKEQGEEEYDYAGVLKVMKEIGAACCIPSFLGRELRNILVLGPKKSGHRYTTEDLDVLFTLAQESAIAIENARLYDEAINKTKELEQINSQLEYAKNLLMKALRETEVANKQLQDTQAQLIHEQKMATLGRLAASVGHEVNNPLTILSMNVSRLILKARKNPDIKVNEVLETFEKMEQNIGRIKAVVNTLTGLLKRSEKGKFEPLSLKLILEETLPLVQFQTYLDNLTGTEVEFDVPGNLPLIRGDLERLQEVFLNLFINAYHAMEGSRNRKIIVRADQDSEDKGMIQLEFEDNGKGMPEDIRKKIFNYGYTTKAPGKGSGLGLYMCKYIIELHGGSIGVRSEAGVGTTFQLKLPIFTEEAVGQPAASRSVRSEGVREA